MLALRLCNEYERLRHRDKAATLRKLGKMADEALETAPEDAKGPDDER